MKVLETAVLAALLFGPGELPAQRASRNGTLDVLVSDTYGHDLKSFEVEIVSERDSATMIKRLRQAGSVDLPYGNYIVRGSASLHEPFLRRVTLKRPHLLVLVAFAFRDPGTSNVVRTSLSGHIDGLPSGLGSNWVRAVSVFGEFVQEAPVDKNGRFEVSEAPYGDYIIVVMHEKEVLAIHRFSKTVREGECRIDLNSQFP